MSRRYVQKVLSWAHSFFPGSRLVVVGDQCGWVLDEEARSLQALLEKAGAVVTVSAFPWKRQAAFFESRQTALANIRQWTEQGIVVTFPYYHGFPLRGNAEFDKFYGLLQKHHNQIARVQVTHAAMRDCLLEAGIDSGKIRTIYIGINSQTFRIPDQSMRDAVRQRLGVPRSAAVIGSFQKDGEGWGEGDCPKLIKGPDVFIKALAILKESVPDLHVLLSGPARGYVKRGLAAAGIPYNETGFISYGDIPFLYHAIDAYLVASREEGGPKAILESMASGVPIISTRVGQATELIRHGENGWLADISDSEALAAFTLKSLSDSSWRTQAILNARQTAEMNDYAAQTAAWTDFFQGLVSFAK